MDSPREELRVRLSERLKRQLAEAANGLEKTLDRLREDTPDDLEDELSALEEDEPQPERRP